jgi:hypothetical protein
MRIPTGLTGAAGEYHVAAELLRRNWLATVTIKNAPRTDVLAQRLDRHRLIAIQTKTASEGSNFTLGERDEDPGESEDQWYVLVGLRDILERPRFYVLPRHAMAAIAYLEHRDWLTPTGLLHSFARADRERITSSRRTIRPRWIEHYLEAWDQLDGSALAAPFRGDPVFLELARRLGLPDGFPPLNRAPRRRRL